MPAFDLADGDVCVWSAGLNQSPEPFRPLLSADERERAARFAFDRDRDRFVVGRGLLRTILGRHLDRPPGSLRFQYLAHGKPTLPEVRFNLAHSHDRLMLAVTRLPSVGVDLERVRPEVGTDEIAARFFSARERAELFALPPECRVAAFFRCWARKEAFLKVTGEGLAFPLERFDVSLAERAALLAVAGDERRAAAWALYDVAAPDGFAAALAVEGRAGRIVEREWDTANGRDRPGYV